LLVLVHLRCGHTYAQLAAGFGVGTTTVYRYVNEAIEILAARAPDLTAALRTARRKAFVILDGTLLSIDRIAADRPYYSGKHHKHGLNVQVIADPFGNLLWGLTRVARRGSRRPRGACPRHHRSLGPSRPLLSGRQGVPAADGTVRVPYRGRWERLSPGQQAVNRSHAKIRALGSRPWPPSRPGGSCANGGAATTRITGLVQAVLALHLNTSS
jgi:hypothetical protein